MKGLGWEGCSVFSFFHFLYSRLPLWYLLFSHFLSVLFSIFLGFEFLFGRVPCLSAGEFPLLGLNVRGWSSVDLETQSEKT